MQTVSELLEAQRRKVSGDKNKDIWSNVLYNVKVYGAKGDGEADDAAAIQEAIDDAYSEGGGIVLCPAGNYIIGTTLVLKTGVTLEGAGATNWDYRFTYGTWLIAKTSLSTLIEVGNSTTGFVVGAAVNNISLTRQGFTNGGAVGAVGLWERNSYNFNSSNIYVEGFSTGVRLGDLTIAKTLNHYYENTNISECDVFINVQSASDVTFNGGRIGTNGGGLAARTTGVRIEGNCDSLAFNRLIIAHNGGMQYNVLITGATVSLFWIIFNDCDMETATVNSVLCDTIATMVRINDSWVGSAAPMKLTTGDRIIVRDCTFANQAGLASIIHVSGNVGNVTIEDNDFSTSPNVNILVDTTVGNVNILNNLINGGGIGVNVATASGAATNLLIENNKIKGQADNAISVSTTNFSQIKIKNNFLEDYVNHGIFAGGGTGDASLDIQGNKIITRAGSGTRRAYYITSAISGVIIMGNDTRGNDSASVDSSVAPKVVANNL